MTMLLLVSAVKLLAEIALMALIGQWIIGLLAGAGREGNFFYRLLGTVTEPVVKLARLLSPRVVIDRHLPLVALALLLSSWMVATLFKIQICLEVGMQGCR
jgi:hypothetical protein